MIFLLCFGGARNCAMYGKLNITPKKDIYRVKRGWCKFLDNNLTAQGLHYLVMFFGNTF